MTSSQQADVATHVESSAHAVLASAIFQPLSEDTSQAVQSSPTRSAGVNTLTMTANGARKSGYPLIAPLRLALTYHSIHRRGFAKGGILGCKRGQGCFESESKEDHPQDQATCSQALDSRQLERERHNQYVQQRVLRDAGCIPASLTRTRR
jgi:hypothetical protein